MDLDEIAVAAVLENWAEATRTGRLDEVLAGHAPDAVIYDVLAPLQYAGTAAYRASWGDWQPQTTGPNLFRLEEVEIVAATGIAYAYGLLRCGGTLADGQEFEDLVRATFCLRRSDAGWQIAHQHISKPQVQAGT